MAWRSGKMSDRFTAVNADCRLENSESFRIAPCPLLPEVGGKLGPEATRQFNSRNPSYYGACLSYAQSLWREGKPAQAILQLNKAFMAELDEDPSILKSWPPPYAVLVWILRNRPDDAFVGNPVRHFQHLATRVSGERKELRAWRAWACFYLARWVLADGDFPIDAEQVEKESLKIPEWGEVLDRIECGGWQGEAEVIRGVAGSL
jgi:hypothetical protein